MLVCTWSWILQCLDMENEEFRVARSPERHYDAMINAHSKLGHEKRKGGLAGRRANAGGHLISSH